VEYERLQRRLHDQSQPLRKEIIDGLRKVLDAFEI
jgi:hypothetical protein